MEKVPFSTPKTTEKVPKTCFFHLFCVFLQQKVRFVETQRWSIGNVTLEFEKRNVGVRETQRYVSVNATLGFGKPNVAFVF